MKKNLLEEGLEKIGFSQAEIKQGIEKLTLYAKELQKGNDEYGLTAIVDYDEIIIRHILDSLAALPHIHSLKKMILQTRDNSTNFDNDSFIIADIGSGGGIPGIPLAIMMEDTQFVLAERMTKRCRFLNYCKESLSLKNVTVETVEAERIAQKRFDMVVFRAFRPLEKKMTRVLLRIIKDDGILSAYKAKKEKILEEMTAIAQWVPSYETIPLYVPFLENHERNLVIVNKKTMHSL